MKRSVLTIISLIIGISFFGLLFLQARIVDALVKMRKEQFDEMVFRALDQASRDMERNETFRYLEMVAQQSEYEADRLSRQMQEQRVQMLLELGDTTNTPFKLQVQIRKPSQMPKALTLKPVSSLDAASQRFQEFVKNAYLYQKGVLDEVIYTILYNASERDFRERVDVRLLESSLHTELEAAGIHLPYHFAVYDSEGEEVYRCADYTEKGLKYASYTVMLFRNDPSQKMGVVRVHFPDMDKYIRGVARTMIPVLVFTIVMFLTFCFTVWLIVRQKRDTEMKNDFINNMTHEFKTPISSISLAAQMLGDKSITKSEAMIDNLSGVIVNETKRLRYQVEKVLQMSLYERNNIRFNEKEIDANSVIDDVVKTFQLKVKQNGGQLTAALDAEDAAIYVDEMHFTNVIFNLMDNAVKYRREDVPLQLNIATKTQGKNLVITVEDNGIGIRHDDLRRIFDRFYRVHTGNQHDVKGFGLGLAYVKTMVDLMHGTIKAESELGLGTKFIITLPLID